MIQRLKQKDLVLLEKSGSTLTKEGIELYKRLTETFTPPVPVELETLDLGSFNYAVVVRDAASKVKVGVEQRDDAVRAGAVGALTIIYVDGKFHLRHEIKDCEVLMPSTAWNTLRITLEPEDGDVLIVLGNIFFQT